MRILLVLGVVLGGLALGAGLPLAAAQEVPADPNAKEFRPLQEAVQVRCPNCLYDEEKGRSADRPAPNVIVPFDAGNPCPICAGKGVMATSIDWNAGVYVAEGFGVPPKSVEREYRDATSDKERHNILVRARVQAARAALQDALRNAKRLAARVRLDATQRVSANRVEHLTAELLGMEPVGQGEWITAHAKPFFKITVRVPMWGVKGLVANLLETARDDSKKQRERRKPFDWKAGGTPGAAPGGGGGKPGEKPGETPGETPGEKPGETPGEKPGAQPGEKPGESESVHGPEKTADKIVGIIIDARAVAKDKGPVNPALFPAIVVKEEAPPAAPGEAPAEPVVQTVHDVADTDPQAASGRGVLSYVESDTPFERLAAVYGARGWLVVRLTDLESEPLAGLGLGLPLQVKFGGGGKKQLTFKVKAADMEGAERANVVISAQDARKLKETDQVTNVLKNCKVVVIAGGDIAGKRGALPRTDGVRTAGR